MKKVIFPFVAMIAILSYMNTAQAQQTGICGTTFEQGQIIKERMLENRRLMPNFVRTRGATTYVPIKIHLVGKNDGSDRMSEGKALDMLCILNEEWEPLDIQFYLKGDFSYIDNTFITSHSSPNQVAIWNQANNYKVNDALNVFVTNSVGGSGAGGGTTLAYFTPLIDCIFIREANVYGANVLPHEVGHFFSLNHPFFGWEDEPWNEAQHGLQVGLFSPAGTPNEKVNDPNCDNESVADAICDTPPDYLFGFGQSGCGEWNQGTMDPNGVVIDPLENNTMSYFSGCDQYLFTEEQIDAIHVDIALPYRAYVNPGITPNLDEVEGVPTPISPVGGAEAPYYNAVTLTWEEVPGATHYYVEVDRFSSFSWNPFRAVVSTNSVFLGNFCQANVSSNNNPYHWRVRAFNEYRTCTAFSDVETFTTNAIASGVHDIQGVDYFDIRPNPTDAQQSVFIDIQSSKPFDASINIYSIAGALVNSQELRIAEGSQSIRLATTDLTAGIYLVTIKSEEGVMTKRLVLR